MAATVRVLRGIRSHTSGEPVGIQLSTFGMQQLQNISGADLAPIIEESLDPAYQQAKDEWAVLTGASSDSIRIEVDEVGPRHARVSLRVGGQQLIDDPRNTKHIDYAPFLEFNGSPGGTPPGVLLYAMTSNRDVMRDMIHARVRELIQERLRGSR